MRDLRHEIEPALNFLGVERRHSVLDYRGAASARIIRTPSAKQVAEPIYTESSGKWRRYEERLAQGADILEKWAACFDYGPK